MAAAWDTEERRDLWLLLGRRVRGSAFRSGRRRGYLTLLRDVRIDGVTPDDAADISHLWARLPPALARQPVGVRFDFEALVQRYERADGSEDVWLTQLTRTW